MALEIDHIKIKQRLFKSLKIKSQKDYTKIKKKLDNLNDIEKCILPTIFFKIIAN